MDTEELFSDIVAAPARGLPTGLVLSEAAAASFAAWLDARGLGDWPIFQSNLNLAPLLEHLPEPAPAEWSRLDPLSPRDGHADRLIERRDSLVRYPAGACLLAPHAIAVARWFYIDPTSGEFRSFELIAAPDEATIDRLGKLAKSRSHETPTPTWRIFRGTYGEPETAPRLPVADDAMVLAPALATRVEREIVGFFRPEVAAMYREMRVPLRRGVLLYGPPGNGKTSLIRSVGAALPNVSATIVRANASFDSDDLEYAINLWSRSAPAMLVIEDLNAIFDRVNLSTVLNLLDGIDTPEASGPLLLVASTNHPDRLDSALTNRPGRFDVVIELPPPDAESRRRYFERQLQGFDAAMIATIVEETDGCSFAHLGEVMRLSGMMAINAGRPRRDAGDVAGAIELVQAARREAEDGFRPPAPQFGLHHLARQRQA